MNFVFVFLLVRYSRHSTKNPEFNPQHKTKGIVVILKYATINLNPFKIQKKDKQFVRIQDEVTII